MLEVHVLHSLAVCGEIAGEGVHNSGRRVQVGVLPLKVLYLCVQRTNTCGLNAFAIGCNPCCYQLHDGCESHGSMRMVCINSVPLWTKEVYHCLENEEMWVEYNGQDTVPVRPRLPHDQGTGARRDDHFLTSPTTYSKNLVFRQGKGRYWIPMHTSTLKKNYDTMIPIYMPRPPTHPPVLPMTATSQWRPLRWSLE